MLRGACFCAFTKIQMTFKCIYHHPSIVKDYTVSFLRMTADREEMVTDLYCLFSYILYGDVLGCSDNFTFFSSVLHLK